MFKKAIGKFNQIFDTPLKKGAFGVVVLTLAGLGIWLTYYLVSPFFIDQVVNEEFPLSAGATIPLGMTQEEVEDRMVAVSNVDAPVATPDPDIMTVMEQRDDGQSTDSSEPIVLATGSFQGADSFHLGSGTATIYELPDNSTLLRLEDFSVTNGPELHVYLSAASSPQSSSEVRENYHGLGRLKGNIGNQNYDIPADLDLSQFNSVVIYCQPFHIVFSVATLQK